MRESSSLAMQVAQSCMEAVLLGASAFGLVMVYLVGNVAMVFHCGEKMVVRMFNYISRVPLPKETFIESLFTAKMMKTAWRMISLYIKSKVKIGGKIPDVQMIDAKTMRR